ncbi:hypothetical protein ACJIZ3_016720 [Penstemon smallii]|uniref:Uncharacterized protein n=1 Tax=Penstemon smallii TaxID=265156 RepID=A0ABD3STX3_9LAMI
MAPSRKKGTNKAAAAEAAAQRKWKVGDLVLAKVKGFPAWPAKVTEPKKWGFPTDWKKVLVSFFGTQQIAFCCPVDVEEFTEKTKVYLLGKRHGKGSDFIRALNEIIDCFENLKEQDEADKDEAAVTKAKLPATNATNDLNSEAAEAAAAEDALHDGERQLVEARKETPVCPTSSTRRKTHVAQSRRRTGRRGSARMLSSSSGIDADSLHDKFTRSSKGMVKSSANFEGHNVDLPDIVSNGSKPVAGKLISENDEGETELSGRLDFQPSTIILKKKRKLNRKRLSNDTAGAGGLDIVVSETEVLKTKCVSPSNKEKMVKRSAKDDLDAHLPLVKRARVRMGRPSPVAEQEDTSVYEDGKMLVVPESLGLQSSGPLNWKVDAPADGKSAPTRRDLPDSSLSQAGPLKKPQFWESRKNFVDDEAALPPSKRLLRALEAMSANVAEDAQRASGCSPTGNTRSNECTTSSSVKCFKSIENKVVTALGSRPLEDHRNLDSRSSASELRVGLNMEMAENEAKTSVLVSDSGKTSRSIDSSNPPDQCNDSFKDAEGAGSKPLMISPLNDYTAEVIAEHQHLKPDSPILIKGMDTTIQIDSPDSDGDDGLGGDEKHKTKHLLLDENNQESQGPEFVADARPVSITSIFKPSATPVKALTSTHFQSQFCSNSISDDQMEGRTVSVIQSSSSLTNGLDSVPRTNPSGSSLCNIPASDNNNYLENSSCSPDVQLQLEKDKFAGTSSKEELLSSFEVVIRSLTRTKESIGRATQIAIDCAKLGFAKKVVEILARSLESESSLCKKVDLFFLVDSITQCSRGMKGDCGIYPSEVQALLPRLLFGAAPPGSSSLENHKQCLKVLRVWQERKVFPEPIICHHIRELDSLCRPYQTGGGSRRAMKNERSFDDPIREMEGMLVDEYGSNSSFQLPGFCMPPMLKDDDGGSDSGGESFEAVTPERSVENLDVEKTPIPATEKRNHILQDVDIELEMEDVAPCYESNITPSRNVSGADRAQISHHRYNSHYGAPFDPQQPKDVSLTSAPLPRSSTPLPPRAPHPIPPSAFSPPVFDSVKNGPESKLYPTSQIFKGNIHESMRKQSILPRGKPTSLSDVHHRAHDKKDFEAQMSRQKPDCSNSSRLYSRTNINHPANGALNKGFHLRPPRPAPSNQFSYVQERVSRRNFPPPSHHDRFHIRNAESGNFYRDRDRNKYSPRDNIGECWRPPLSPIAGPCYYNDARMDHPYAPYSDSPRRTASPNNRWNYSPRPMNHRHFNPYRPPFEGPIPVANRGPKYWRPN